MEMTKNAMISHCIVTAQRSKKGRSLTCMFIVLFLESGKTNINSLKNGFQAQRNDQFQ